MNDTLEHTPGTSGPEEPTTAHPGRRGVRVATVVWGLVVAALGVGLLAWALGVTFDVELAFIALLAAAGVLLLVGSVATTRRRRNGS